MSAPALRAEARQRPERAANQGQCAQEIGANAVRVSSCEFLKLNSRCGGGYADLPYGIYVYHYLFAPMLRSVPLHSFPGGYAIGAIVCVTFYLTVPLAIAIASYRWFEAPFLALKDGR